MSDASDLPPRATRAPAPLRYTLTIADPAAQMVEVAVEIPADVGADVELMMAVWSPGFYRREDYASRVHDVSARAADGAPLAVAQPAPNRWRIVRDGPGAVVLTYRLRCADQSVTTNWVDADGAVLNGAATFITLSKPRQRPHEVTLRFPTRWAHTLTAMPRIADGSPQHYRAADFDTLVDSPILAGTLAVHRFVVGGSCASGMLALTRTISAPSSAATRIQSSISSRSSARRAGLVSEMLPTSIGMLTSCTFASRSALKLADKLRCALWQVELADLNRVQPQSLLHLTRQVEQCHRLGLIPPYERLTLTVRPAEAAADRPQADCCRFVTSSPGGRYATVIVWRNRPP